MNPVVLVVAVVAAVLVLGKQQQAPAPTPTVQPPPPKGSSFAQDAAAISQEVRAWYQTLSSNSSPTFDSTNERNVNDPSTGTRVNDQVLV